MNNTDDRFSIIPGIVDTDTFDAEINFPIIINGDKYPILETTIERGTPYVQVIPFKRDSWKMKIERKSAHDQKKSRFIQNIHILNNYKNIWWNKKSWK
jgi:MinD superfamily P-loop ATPase